MAYVLVWTASASVNWQARWEDVRTDSLTVDGRYCRGDWGAPKSEAPAVKKGAPMPDNFYLPHPFNLNFLFQTRTE